MPIASHKPTATEAPPPNIPKIISTEVKSTVVDVQYTPLQSLLTYVEGMAYVVNFYLQVLSSSSATSGQDPSKLGQYQQYKRIDGAQIKLTQALTSSQVTENKTMVVQGAGHVANIVVNAGDMFVADVGDGREGVFQIIDSEKKSVMMDSVYFITFELLYFSDRDAIRRKDLDEKVVQHLHWVQDFVQTGNNPMVSTSEYNALGNLSAAYGKLVHQYFDAFYNREYATLTVPGQVSTLYDHYVVQFLRTILDSRSHPLLNRMRALNVNEDLNLKQPTIWSALLEREIIHVQHGVKVMKKVNVGHFFMDPFMEGIRYSGISDIVYPAELYQLRSSSFGRDARMKPGSMTDITVVTNVSGDTRNLVVTEDSTPPEFPDIYNTLSDQWYVLSKAFYEIDGGKKSKLEVYTENYLQGEPNNPVEILRLAKASFKWGGMERFYYIPILLTLIKALVKEI